MAKFVVFLRGVNVGGVKVLMKDLSALLESAGYLEVKTLLASGNVVLRARTDDPLVVQEHCNALLLEHYGRQIPTLVYTRAEVLELGGQFGVSIPEPLGEHHGYLTLCETQAAATDLYAAARELEQAGELAVSGRALCWIGRKGQSTTNPMSKLMTTQARQRVITTRNHNTLVKLAAILR